MTRAISFYVIEIAIAATAIKFDVNCVRKFFHFIRKKGKKNNNF